MDENGWLWFCFSAWMRFVLSLCACEEWSLSTSSLWLNSGVRYTISTSFPMNYIDKVLQRFVWRVVWLEEYQECGYVLVFSMSFHLYSRTKFWKSNRLHREFNWVYMCTLQWPFLFTDIFLSLHCESFHVDWKVFTLLCFIFLLFVTCKNCDPWLKVKKF